MYPGAPVVIRAANSIDIYSLWEDVLPALYQMSEDFEDHPLLIFFNRSIIVKPRGQRRMRLAGYVSIRGFHHIKKSLDRGGEPPYTLFLPD